MLYTFLVCICVLLGFTGLVAICYLIMLSVIKTDRNYKSVVILPVDGDENSDKARIEYAYERINLFGERKNISIYALEKDNIDYSATEKYFEQYNSVNFTHLGEMPFLLSSLLDN